eukprot:1180784-Prorocentrum_minimum.AAC.3
MPMRGIKTAFFNHVTGQELFTHALQGWAGYCWHPNFNPISPGTNYAAECFRPQLTSSLTLPGLARRSDKPSSGRRPRGGRWEEAAHRQGNLHLHVCSWPNRVL